MNLRFDGQVVAVSGAGHGLGRAIAESFAGLGARVFGCAPTAVQVAGVEMAAVDLADRNAGAAWIAAVEQAAGVPVRVAHLQTVWTMTYTRPAAYNWMLQYYLRAEGLALSWVGTGRLIFSLDIDETLFDDIVTRIVAAGRRMMADGWWDGPAATNKQLKRQALKESLAARLCGG